MRTKNRTRDQLVDHAKDCDPCTARGVDTDLLDGLKDRELPLDEVREYVATAHGTDIDGVQLRSEV